MTNPTALLTESEVSEIEARANAATKGPWAAYHRVSPRGAHKHWHIGNSDGLCQITMSGHERDYQFMAHARTDIPALIRGWRALKAQCDDLQIRFGAACEHVKIVEGECRTKDETIAALREQLAQLTHKEP